MLRRYQAPAAVAALMGLLMIPTTTYGDEGMWLFNSPPREQLKAKYQFEPTDAWLEHVQKASVRFNSGGSGSFVSADGLVMTNHHVAAHDLDKVSTPEKNYLRDGFYAKTKAEEIKCKGLELNVLLSIKDVTNDVNAATNPQMPPAEAFKVRQAKISEIQNAAADEPKGIRADVVTLYAGGQYHLYTFKKFTDIRIVFAPEKQIAFFGGDPDNFEYPRYDLDVAFFRVYENDQPVKPEHYLSWSKDGAKDGELTFVSGHPGRTSRQFTMSELKYMRDLGYPYLMQRLNRLEVTLAAWAGRSERNSQRAEEELFSIQNSRKARTGGLAGLLDPKLYGRKEADEKRLQDFIAASADPEIKNAAAAFDMIAKANKVRAEMVYPYTMLEAGGGFNCDSFAIARKLLRAADEIPKPEGERLPEFAKSRLGSFQFQLFSDAPIYEDFETVKLADSLTNLAATLGTDTDLVKQILAGKSPRERAFELISGTKVRDPKVRQQLFEGGKAAIDAAKDPMIELARLVDPASRELRKKYEAEVDEPRRQGYALLAKARYAMDGTKVYPDATFTLRLAFGTVKGYKEDGKDVPAFTTIDGLYARSKEQGNKGVFELPKRWEERRGKIDLKTPMNFVSTADIIGGNSGSPVINRNGEVVGLIFDGNIQSLVLDFIYDEEHARAVSVDSRAITEALKNVYDAPELLAELTTPKK